MILTFWPVLTVAAKTRPKAEKRPLSGGGIILEMYIMSGPFGSHVRMLLAHWSSRGPVYSESTRYFCSAAGEGRCCTSISSSASCAGSHFCMQRLSRGFWRSSRSSLVSVTPTAESILVTSSYFSSMQFLKTLPMGVRQNMQEARSRPAGLVPSVVLIHFFSLGLKKLSPHRRCIIFSMSTPNFFAYMRANLVRVNAQPCRPAEKDTVPLVGSTCTSPSASSWYVETSTLTFSTCLTKAVYMSSDGSCSSRNARSSLLIVMTGLMRSPMAWRSTVSVCTHTPSTQSTTKSAPSVTRRAAVTSDEKSTWPGESIRLIRNSSPSEASGSLTCGSILKNSEMPVDLMVMQRSCSSWRVSVRRVSPADDAAMIPAAATSESVRVDLP